jgi:hypothetical protein
MDTPRENRTLADRMREAIADIGGEPLEGSGFEDQDFDDFSEDVSIPKK